MRAWVLLALLAACGGGPPNLNQPLHRLRRDHGPPPPSNTWVEPGKGR